MVTIGLISYPLYLWHWPLLSFAQISEGAVPAPSIRSAAVLLAIILAWLTTRFVENPIRGAPKQTSVVLPLIACMAICAIFGFTVFLNNGLAERSVEIAKFSELQKQLAPTAEIEKRVLCRTKTRGSSFPNCIYLANDAEATVALVGDSHAEHYFYGLSEHFSRQKENLVFMQIERLFLHQTCEANGPVWNKLVETSASKTVIISPYSANYVFDEATESGKSAKKDYTACLFNSVKKLVDSGKNVIYVLDIPRLNFDIRSCLARPLRISSEHVRSPCAVSRSFADSQASEYGKTIFSVLGKLPGVSIYNPAGALCDAESCWAVKDGQVLYRDDNHLSYTGSMYFSDRLLPN